MGRASAHLTSSDTHNFGRDGDGDPHAVAARRDAPGGLRPLARRRGRAAGRRPPPARRGPPGAPPPRAARRGRAPGVPWRGGAPALLAGVHLPYDAGRWALLLSGALLMAGCLLKGL